MELAPLFVPDQVPVAVEELEAAALERVDGFGEDGPFHQHVQIDVGAQVRSRVDDLGQDGPLEGHPGDAGVVEGFPEAGQISEDP